MCKNKQLRFTAFLFSCNASAGLSRFRQVWAHLTHDVSEVIMKGGEKSMAKINVVSQRYYKENKLQYVNAVFDDVSFAVIIEEVATYITGVTGLQGALGLIESITATKIAEFNSEPPSASDIGDGALMNKGRFIVAFTFRRTNETIPSD